MISKTILHIGSHKTGSTYLQQYLHDNRDALLLYGIHYPQLAENPYIQQHSALALALRAGDRTAALDAVGKVAEEARGVDADTLLLSGEEFFFSTADEIALLKQVLSHQLGCSFRVIVYIRNTYDYVRSQLNHHLRFENYPFSETMFLGRVIAYQPADVIRRWEAAFGDDAVQVFSYDEHKRVLLDHFLRLIGMPRVAEPNVSREAANPSIDFLSALVVNQLLYDKSADLKHRVYWKIVAQGGECDDVRFPSELAVIESIVAQMALDYGHPKLQAIAPYVAGRGNRRLTSGRETEAVSRLVSTLDVLSTMLDELHPLRRGPGQVMETEIDTVSAELTGAGDGRL